MTTVYSPASGGSRRLCLLSNGSYSVMLREDGTGVSRWRDLAVTRWREDHRLPTWGTFMLLRDEHSDALWSPTAQPFASTSSPAQITFGSGRALFARQAGAIDSTLEVAVARDGDVELRRLTLVNRGDAARMLSLTSYTELVLGAAADDNAHPTFSKMFVQTEWDSRAHLVLATRRKRKEREPAVWSGHALRIEATADVPPLEYETDRGKFLGRGKTLRNAQALRSRAPLSNSAGCVLDPIVSLRQRFTLEPGHSIRLSLWTQLADSREGVMALGEGLQDSHAADDLLSGAAEYAASELERFEIDAARAARFNRWLGALLISDASQRAAPEVAILGRGGPPALWAGGISGDRPIALIRLENVADVPAVADLLVAQSLWRAQRTGVDVVVMTAPGGAAGETIETALKPLVDAQQSALRSNGNAAKAELFALREKALGDGLRNGLYTAARLLLGAAPDGSPAREAPARAPAPMAPVAPAALAPARGANSRTASGVPAEPKALEFANGSGGFIDDGRAYQIDLSDGRCTPAPWVNVIANPGFGSMVSAEGGGYSWANNSQQNPITPWPNDPVSDTPHEVLFLRDEAEGSLWSATALPIRVPGARYSAVHGKGWTRFHNDAHGIGLELTICVPTADSLKLSRLRLSNRSDAIRTLSITGYVEWALGPNGTAPAPFIVTSQNALTGALFACNRWRSDFADHVAFIDFAGRQHAMSGDRGEFLGACGSLERPASLQGDRPLSGRLGGGLDPCGALQTRIVLPPHSESELLFMLGDAESESAAEALVVKYRTVEFEQVLADVGRQWNQVLETVRVQTPDRAMDVMLNEWLLYQALGCRLWARTAYYQSSGAYGFRDQLQDVMALCLSRPDLAREQLLRAAGRQFPEGDVQHWWLPPRGQGIRTTTSDDRIWLAYVAAHYVGVSGDGAVLEVPVPFLSGPPLAHGETEAFFEPEISAESVSVYEHCARGLDCSLTSGAHGLPLIQTGDWNDGMNAVGREGRGESTWLGWFTLAAIAAFSPYAEKRGEQARATRWRNYAARVRSALEEAWDGAWYRRGYYDDGTPLGSHESLECQIDSIAQSWSVMAGASNPEHAAEAMAAVDRLLIDRHYRLARLFTPPFDRAPENPGYIKGYPPGVRENGGQYTHGAIWSIFAWAELGDGDRASELFGLMNPISHSDSPAAAERYRVEPYVVCADVYSTDVLAGRGGWTWYTGSAAWLYRAGVEAILGFQRCGERLRIDPCIPRKWPGFKLTYQHRSGENPCTTYDIAVENPQGASRGVSRIELDGRTLDPREPIALAGDGKTHVLRVLLGAS